MRCGRLLVVLRRRRGLVALVLVRRNLFGLLSWRKGCRSRCCRSLEQEAHTLQIAPGHGLLDLRRVQVWNDAGHDERLFQIGELVCTGQPQGGADSTHEGFALRHRGAVRQEPPVLLPGCAVLHGGGLQSAVDLFRGLHQPEAAGRLRHADGDGNGDVVDVLAVAAYSGLARGAGHFDAPLAAFRSAGGRVHDADIRGSGQLHAAHLRDRKRAAGLFKIDVLAGPAVRVVLPGVQLHLGNDDALEVGRRLHRSDRHQDVIPICRVLVELEYALVVHICSFLLTKEPGCDNMTSVSYRALLVQAFGERCLLFFPGL